MLGLRVWPGNKANVLPVEHIIISSTEESAAGEVQYQDHVIAFFDIDGLVHHEFVPTGQTVNKEFYKTVLQRLRDVVRRHRPQKWRSGKLILHHDNAPARRLSPQMNFRRNTTFRRSHNLPTPLTLLRVTFSCSHN